ncbi:hypothetical protein [Lentzea sp. NPDC059081]|uniref:hypothetical protein n=1 Tax=Lentzea sp. NPDC059081 TaxID=3346719 RepID=UPI0036C24250
MTEEERPSTGADVRTVAQAALLVLGTGVTLLNGWVIGDGVGGVLVAAFAAAIFLGVYWGRVKESPSTNRRVVKLAACVAASLLLFFLVTLTG